MPLLTCICGSSSEPERSDRTARIQLSGSGSQTDITPFRRITVPGRQRDRAPSAWAGLGTRREARSEIGPPGRRPGLRTALAAMEGSGRMRRRSRREDATPDARHDDPERRTRERAHLLWERAGRPEGRADEFREQARREEEAQAAAEEDERVDGEARASFPASDPPSHTGITGAGRRGFREGGSGADGARGAASPEKRRRAGAGRARVRRRAALPPATLRTPRRRAPMPDTTARRRPPPRPRRSPGADTTTPSP